MWNPFQRFFSKDAVTQSLDVVERIRKHEEKNRPRAQAAYDELDRQAIELAPRVNAAATARSKTEAPLRAELDAIIIRRESAFYSCNQERDRLYAQLLALTKPVVDSFCADCVVKSTQIEDIRKNGLARKQYDPKRDVWTTFLPTNTHVRVAAQQLVEKARRQVSAMQHVSLDRIQKAIAEFEQAFEALDFDELREQEVTESQLADMLFNSKPVEPQFDRTWLTPVTQYTDSRRRWLTEQTNERIEKARRA